MDLLDNMTLPPDGLLTALGSWGADSPNRFLRERRDRLDLDDVVAV